MNGEWRTAPLRRSLVRIRASNTDSAATLLSLTIDGATVPRSGEDGLGQQAPSESTIQNYALVEPEQLVVNPMWLVGGSIGVSTLSGAVSPAYRVYSINDSIEPRFLHHVVRSTSYRSFYRMLARGETTFDVNGQVEVPGFGQVKVPTLCGLFRGSGAVLLDVGGLGACGRTGRW